MKKIEKHKSNENKSLNRIELIAVEKLETIKNLTEKNIVTSISLPNWNRYRLKALTQTAGIKHISEYRLALTCLNILLKENNMSKIQRKRATFYNEDRYSYQKIGIIISEEAHYIFIKIDDIICVLQ